MSKDGFRFEERDYSGHIVTSHGNEFLFWHRHGDQATVFDPLQGSTEMMYRGMTGFIRERYTQDIRPIEERVMKLAENGIMYPCFKKYQMYDPMRSLQKAVYTHVAIDDKYMLSIGEWMRLRGEMAAAEDKHFKDITISDMEACKVISFGLRGTMHEAARGFTYEGERFLVKPDAIVEIPAHLRRGYENKGRETGLSFLEANVESQLGE